MRNTIRWTIALASLSFLAQGAAAGGRLATPPNPQWRTECGSCHIPYPPQLLPAAAWHRILSALDRHFGTDASVEPAVRAEIAAYLERYSGTSARLAAPAETPRITETAWFVHEHHEVPVTLWRTPAVKSAANCAACHTGAEQGDFRVRNIRIPR